MRATGVILNTGDRLGGYCTDRVIGLGGMAVVYRAEQLSLTRPVALKVLSGELSPDASFRERFRREAMHAASLEHPHIVPVYDAGEADGLLFIAMRLIEGGTLAGKMSRGGLDPTATVDLLRPVASALDAAHAIGLVHRDVKPQNILLAHDGHPYLTDFGIVKAGDKHGLTATNGFVGSVNYASPEQIRGEPLGPASDVDSLTAVAYQCLTGELPYPRETDAGVMQAHLSEPPPALTELDHPAAQPLQKAIERGMAKQPNRRFATASAFVAAIDAALEGDGGASRASASPGGASRRQPGTDATMATAKG